MNCRNQNVAQTDSAAPESKGGWFLSEQEFIGYHETEELLVLYPQIAAILENKQLELKLVFVDEDTLLYTIYVGNKALSDMPISFPSSPDSKVINTINAKDRIVKEEHRKLIADINSLAIVYEKLTVALSKLPGAWHSLIVAKYHERLTWKEIEANQSITRIAGRSVKRDAIERVKDTCQVSMAQYKECMARMPRK